VYLLCAADFEKAGYRIFSSLYDGEGAYLIGPSLKAYSMRRGPRTDTWWLDGYVHQPGIFIVTGIVPAGHSPLALMLDSGASINVAGPRWQSFLSKISSEGISVAGVGGGATASDGSGTLTIHLTSHTHLVPQGHIDGLCGLSSSTSQAEGGWCEEVIVEGDAHYTLPLVHMAPWYHKAVPEVQLADEDAATSSSRRTKIKQKKKVTRRASRYTPLTYQQLSERVGLTEKATHFKARDHYIGVLNRPRGVSDVVQDNIRAAAMQRRRKHHLRTEYSHQLSLSILIGSVWHWDVTAVMNPSPEGYLYAMVFIEERSRLIFAQPLRGKTAELMLVAVKALLVMVKSKDRVVTELRGDFDPAFAVQGRGDMVDTAAVMAFRAEHSVLFRTSPPNAHQLNRAEPFMGTLFAQMIVNLVRAGFSRYAWWDMLQAAVLQLNLRPLPLNRRVDGDLTSRYESWHGFKYDLSRWIGWPGQPVCVSTGDKPSTGESPGAAAYFIMPVDNNGGFSVRVLADMKAWITFDVRPLADPNLRFASMILHDKLNQQRTYIGVPQDKRSAYLRALHRASPTMPSMDEVVVVVDPIDGMPIRLLPTYDPLTGEISVLPDDECEAADALDSPLNSNPTPPPNPSPAPDTNPSHPLHHWTAPSFGIRNYPSAAFLRGLPRSTLIAFDPAAKKSGKSAPRFEKYRIATTIQQLSALNSNAFFIPDLKYDLAHSLVAILGVQYNVSTGKYSFTPTPPVPTHPTLPPVYAAMSPPNLNNLWNEVTLEDVDDGDGDDDGIDEVDVDDDGDFMDLSEVLKQDMLASPGDSSAAVATLRQVEALTHDSRFADLAKIAEVEGTLAALLALEAQDGGARPPIVSNASADSVVMDPLEVRDRLDGFSEVFFGVDGKVLDGPPHLPAAFPAQQVLDDSNLKIKQALTSNLASQFVAALALDVKLMKDNNAIRLCPYSDYLKAIDKYGKKMVDLRHIVYACKVKRNAKGVITKCKVRGCVADATRFGKVPDTYSATVAPSSRRLLAQLMALFPDATSAQNDVRGAYYCGTPLHPDQGGRSLYCFIPDELVPYGFPQHDKDGKRNLLEITGNIPGRQEAGKIWGEEYTRFLTSECKLIQSKVDRRLFYDHDEQGKLFLVAVYVDDSWYISTSSLLETSFVEKWAAQYSTASDSSATEGEFCGIVIERKDDGSVVLRGDRLFDDLDTMLEGHPLPNGFTTDYPMAGNAHRHMHAAPSEKNPLLDHRYQAQARSIVGLGGFLCCNVRPDAYHSFVAITQCVAHHLTLFVWKCILRWAHYLVRVVVLFA
jgi:hypothetical protein